MFKTSWVFVGAVLLAADIALAQTPASIAETKTPKFYHLDFVVKEVEDGRTLNSRTYSMVVSSGGGLPEPTSRRASVRTGSKVPVLQTYLDLGVNIDCTYWSEDRNGISLDVDADVSSVASGSDTASNEHPIIRQNKWHSPVHIELKRATTIFSSDDVSSKRKMQVELTATPIAQ